MTNDDARARSIEENRRRSEVMAESQRFGHRTTSSTTAPAPRAPTPKATRGP